MHRGQAGAGGTAEEIEEKRLDLIVGVMGEEKAWAIMLAGRLGKEAMAGFPAGGFER